MGVQIGAYWAARLDPWEVRTAKVRGLGGPNRDFGDQGSEGYMLIGVRGIC